MAQNILISGASGFIGRALVPYLSNKGHRVFSLRRSEDPEGKYEWNPEKGILHPELLDEIDTVINLNGENIASGRWSEERKHQILVSRISSTRLLSGAIRKSGHPHTLINASAVGIYGDRGDEILTENSAPGSGFLATVGKEWETAALEAVSDNTRVVCLRLGVVLSPTGGMLKRLTPFFKLGLGGRVGNGKQYMSLIPLAELLNIFDFVINNRAVSGALNAVLPKPLTNEEFTKRFAGAFERPALFPVPASIVKFVFGEMGRELLLASVRAVPRRLEEAGYVFSQKELSFLNSPL